MSVPETKMSQFKSKIKIHKPVLANEVIRGFGLELAPLNIQDCIYRKEDKPKFIDATVGAGGHALEIIKRGGYVLGIDFDKEMLEVARKNIMEALRAGTLPGPEAHRAVRLSEPEVCPTDNFELYFKLVEGNFREIDTIAQKSALDRFTGILFDLGISSIHFESNRGFSFNKRDSKLDMRLSSENQSVTASMILNILGEAELKGLFEITLPTNKASKLTRKVVEFRKAKKIDTVGDFLEIISLSKLASGRNKFLAKLNPATLPFLALRITVNSELESLKEALPKSFKLLKDGGRLLVISFHSGEDRIVKHFFREMENLGFAEILTPKPIVPDIEEINQNPRARSSKLRILEKIK